MLLFSLLWHSSGQKQLKEGKIYFGSQFEFITVGKPWQWVHGVRGHTASSGNRAMSSCFLLCIRSRACAHGWYHLHVKWVPHSALQRQSFTGLPGQLFLLSLNPTKLKIKLNHQGVGQNHMCLSTVLLWHLGRNLAYARCQPSIFTCGVLLTVLWH